MMTRRLFVTRSLGLTAGATLYSMAGRYTPSFALSLPSYRMIDLDLLDIDRQRPVPTRLYLPERATTGNPVPLVTFSHGLGGSRYGYQYLASHWANAGIASMHPQHIGSDHSLWRGNPLELVQRLQSAARESEALARVQDLRFALDQVLASAYGQFVDESKIAVAGHSYGANTAMLVSGARVTTTELRLNNLRDNRIQAAILISAPPLVGQGPMENVLNAVSIPTLHITSVDDTINLPGYRSTVEDRLTIFGAMIESPKTLAVFNTGGHSIFTDRITRSGSEISTRIKNATRELCTIFLEDSIFNASTASLQQSTKEWLERHGDVLHRFVTPISFL